MYTCIGKLRELSVVQRQNKTYAKRDWNWSSINSFPSRFVANWFPTIYCNYTFRYTIFQHIYHLHKFYFASGQRYFLGFGMGELPKVFEFSDAGDEWFCRCLSDTARYHNVEEFIDIKDGENSNAIIICFFIFHKTLKIAFHSFKNLYTIFKILHTLWIRLKVWRSLQDLKNCVYGQISVHINKIQEMELEGMSGGSSNLGCQFVNFGCHFMGFWQFTLCQQHLTCLCSIGYSLQAEKKPLIAGWEKEEV